MVIGGLGVFLGVVVVFIGFGVFCCSWGLWL